MIPITVAIKSIKQSDLIPNEMIKIIIVIKWHLSNKMN